MALLLTTTTLPGLLTKPSWVVTKKLSTIKTKGQVGATICSAYDNTAKVNMHNEIIRTQRKSLTNA